MSEYKEKLATLWQGVAVLKIDDNIKLWTRSAIGVGFQLDGLRTPEAPAIIIKAKLDNEYVCPRKLKNRKVLYRFYKEQDKHGEWRSYLYLASRTGDFCYRGTRCVVISRQGAFVIAEKSLRERLRALWVNENDGYQPSEKYDDIAAGFYPAEY